MSREQLCPKCGTREAAGSYCTKCLRRMTAADWRETVRSDEQIAASGRNAHLRAESRSASKETAVSGAVA